MYVESEEAKAERVFNENANRISEGPGCWICDDTSGARCLGPHINGVTYCFGCDWYIAFYRVADGYYNQKDLIPDITWAEALWLAKQFYSIKSDYMCNGEDGAWLKQYKPDLYKELLKRQAYLMDGKTEDLIREEPEEVKPLPTGQMNIDDYLASLGGGYG